MTFKRTALKLSTIILLVTLLLVTAGLFATNLYFKNQYDNLDKNDLFWNYTKILEKPFKHVKIVGGNNTRIVFEASKSSAVRVLKYWDEQNKGTVKTDVKNDTLYISFTDKLNNNNDHGLQDAELVRISAPQLLSVDGTDTHFELQKLKQTNLSINLKGKSNLMVESLINNFDTLNITQRDSSKTVFEMSTDYKGPRAISFQHVKADIYNHSLLDIGNGYINDLKLNMADSSNIIVSGKSLSKMHQ